MKAIKFLSMLLLVMALPVLVSCSDDDDEPLESVIVGNWHSYKAIISSSYGKKTVTVTQNGEYASLYMEAIFASNKTAIVKSWLESEDGQTIYWGDTRCVYTIDGNDLTVIAEDGEKLVAKYYPKSKDIVWTMLVKDPTTGGLITGNIYFKK